MAYSQKVKSQAEKMRKLGHSIKEIAQKMNIAQSTASLWLKDVSLNSKAQDRLAKRHQLGQYKAMLTRKRKKEIMIQKTYDRSLKYINSLEASKTLNKLFCSLLFWAEGAKEDQRVMFINSDPKMISTFLKLFRSSFPVSEDKFRVLMHLHEYHNEKELRKYWSKVSKIPQSQFTKSYKKPHTKTRKRPNYKGCVRITYHDASFARELHSIYNMFAKSLGA